MNVSFANVIEAHRQAVGAESVHVDLVEGATPEGLAKELAQVRALAQDHQAFRPEERAEAQIARLRALLREVDRLARTGETRAIISKLDMIPEVKLPCDTEWMAKRRLKRREALPSGYVPAV